MSPFRVFGGLTALFGIALLGAILRNVWIRSPGGHSLLSLTSVSAMSLITGWGLIRHHKWAAILFATALALMGAWISIMSIGRVPMPWIMVNLAFGLALMGPSVITVRCWSLLR
jgi:hypothetical protein